MVVLEGRTEDRQPWMVPGNGDPADNQADASNPSADPFPPMVKKILVFTAFTLVALLIINNVTFLKDLSNRKLMGGA